MKFLIFKIKWSEVKKIIVVEEKHIALVAGNTDGAVNHANILSTSKLALS